MCTLSAIGSLLFMRPSVYSKMTTKCSKYNRLSEGGQTYSAQLDQNASAPQEQYSVSAMAYWVCLGWRQPESHLITEKNRFFTICHAGLAGIASSPSILQPACLSACLPACLVTSSLTLYIIHLYSTRVWNRVSVMYKIRSKSNFQEKIKHS